MSPSSRGRGLKSRFLLCRLRMIRVALFTRAWIEIYTVIVYPLRLKVALFTRAWIEIKSIRRLNASTEVALFTRAWIEMVTADSYYNKEKVGLLIYMMLAHHGTQEWCTVSCLAISEAFLCATLTISMRKCICVKRITRS